MNPYDYLRPLLFRLDPERAHNRTLVLLARMPVFMPRGSGVRPSPIVWVWLQASIKTVLPSARLTAPVLASSKSAPSPRGRSRATRARACSACPSMRPSSTAWVLTISALTP